MSEIIHLLIPIIISLLVIASTSIFVFLKSNSSILLKFFLVPITLALSIFIPIFLSSIVGLAKPYQNLPEKAKVIAHKTLIKEGIKKNIEVWIVEETHTRLIVVPYNKSLEQALKEAQKAREAGYNTEIKRESEKKKQNSDADESTYTAIITSPSDYLPPKLDDGNYGGLF